MMKVRNDTNWIIRLCSIAIVPRFCLIFDSLNPTRVGRMRRTWSRLEFRDGSGVKDHKIYHKNWKVIESSSAPANGELAGGNKTSSLGTLSLLTQTFAPTSSTLLLLLFLIGPAYPISSIGCSGASK